MSEYESQYARIRSKTSETQISETQDRPYGLILTVVILILLYLCFLAYATVQVVWIETRTGNEQLGWQDVYDYNTRTFKTTWYKILNIHRYITYAGMGVATIVAVVMGLSVLLSIGRR